MQRTSFSSGLSNTYTLINCNPGHSYGTVLRRGASLLLKDSEAEQYFHYHACVTVRSSLPIDDIADRLLARFEMIPRIHFGYSSAITMYTT